MALELCAGAGGQALGFEQAGIDHVALVEKDTFACQTLRLNRPDWNAICQDLNTFDCSPYKGVDIVSGGIPCPPFSVAGKQLGHQDERNLFPALIRIVDEVRPKAVMIENVRGLLAPAFAAYRDHVNAELRKLGYYTGWKLMNACDFGVSQLRPRVAIIALKNEYSEQFCWPSTSGSPPSSIGDLLYDLMSANKWENAEAWRRQATTIAPTIVGGSHKHGGPDLGPTRARRAWAELGVDGSGLSDDPPFSTFVGMPKLTVRMVARIQGFSDDWQFVGRKTAAYRQVGNAFPPPVSYAIAASLRNCLTVPKLIRVAG